MDLDVQTEIEIEPPRAEVASYVSDPDNILAAGSCRNNRTFGVRL